MASFRIKALLGTLALAVAAALSHGASAVAADDVNVRFSWKMKGEYGYLYRAKEDGLFEKQNLNVSMGEGAGSQAALGGLLQGQEDVVIMPAIFAISAIQKGMPIQVVALYHPRTPVVVISDKDNPVNEPKDMEGRSMAGSVGETGTSFLSVFCKINDVDCDKIKMVLVNAQSRVPQFLQGQVDMVTVYRSNDLPLLERQTGREFAVLDMSQYGYAAPGMAAVTSKAKIQERGDVLKRFLAASSEAVALTRADPDKSAEALMANWTNHPDAEAVKAQVQATVDAIPELGDKPAGWIEDKAIEEALELLVTEEGFGEPQAPGTYYTNELLQD